MSDKETLQFQPPHKVTDKEKEFLDTRTPREKELHRLAVQMLGSSYFTGKTHGFTKWLQSNPTQPPPATK